MTQWSTHSTPKRPHTVRSIVAVGITFIPSLLLSWKASDQTSPWHNSILLLAIVEAAVAVGLIVRVGATRTAMGPWALLMYLVTLVTLRFVAYDPGYPADQLRVAVGLLAFVLLLALSEVRQHRGNVRQAKFLLKKLLSRGEWPAYDQFHALPEVQALKDALEENAAPALPFLAHPDPNIQVAILTAMAYQPTWRKGQVETVFHYLAASDEPAVRAAAVIAAARVRKTRHLNVLLAFLHDHYSIVRRATAQAIMWDVHQRWTTIRSQIRLALAEPNAVKDGPLPCSTGLPAIAIHDLLLWSGEAGPVGKRSTQTIIRHCKRAITEDGTPEAIDQVLELVANEDVPASIRVELAHQLNHADVFAPEVAAKLIDSSQPTMLRLMAAGALLSQREDKRAIEVLRDAARQPNREIALAAAGIIQKYLSIDVGLPVGGELPLANSRQAAEVTRRVMEWANNEKAPSSYPELPEGLASVHSDEF